ncbi:hypothetical protein HG531_002189 [Fusarium graminearum]|nr:hypothetical protein HG531_002189 [Fusarium graminearum]
MLAQVLTAGAAGLGASVAEGAGCSATGSFSSEVPTLGSLVPQADDSSVGIDKAAFSLGPAPLVGAAAGRPRVLRPPRSVARPLPRPPSDAPRPPRAARGPADVASFEGVGACDACDGFVLVAVSLLESKKYIGLRPVGEHLADHRSLVAILLSKLAKIAFVFECTLGISSAVIGLVAIGSSAAATGETSSTTAARASAARGGCP